MTPQNQHERFNADNADILSENVWEDDPSTPCRACGTPLASHHRRCPECGAVVPVCIGSCGACISPVCVGDA